jgi:hypothetical protein
MPSEDGLASLVSLFVAKPYNILAVLFAFLSFPVQPDFGGNDKRVSIAHCLPCHQTGRSMPVGNGLSPDLYSRSTQQNRPAGHMASFVNPLHRYVLQNVP